jgi:hypothetical protein
MKNRPSSNPSTLQPFNSSTLRMAVAIPLIACVLFGVAAHILVQRSTRNWHECEACAQAAATLSPYLTAVRAYDAAKARLRDAGSIAKVPETPLGVPQAERTTERGNAIDGFVSVRETFAWPSLKTGQAFAVLESFSSASQWRLAAMRLKALLDGESASLSVTLEGVEPAEDRRE